MNFAGSQMEYNVLRVRAVAGFKATTCLPPQKFIKCTDLDFTTSTAIAFIQCCMPFSISM